MCPPPAHTQHRPPLPSVWSQDRFQWVCGPEGAMRHLPCPAHGRSARKRGYKAVRRLCLSGQRWGEMRGDSLPRKGGPTGPEPRRCAAVRRRRQRTSASRGSGFPQKGGSGLVTGGKEGALGLEAVGSSPFHLQCPWAWHRSPWAPPSGHEEGPGSGCSVCGGRLEDAAAGGTDQGM